MWFVHCPISLLFEFHRNGSLLALRISQSLPRSLYALFILDMPSNKIKYRYSYLRNLFGVILFLYFGGITSVYFDFVAHV